MARTFRNIQIEGRDAWALFDTGSLRSYIRDELAPNTRQKVSPFKVGIGGGRFTLNEVCLLRCEIEGLGFDVKAYPVKRIGKDEHGREIDATIGATAMGEWGLTPDPKTGSIDLTFLRKREFTEFKI